MNSLLRNALRALLEADSRIDSDKIDAPLGGGGSVEVEKLTTYEHTGEVVYQLTLTPPPLGTGQNAVHSNDDDGDDGVYTKVFRPFSAGTVVTSEMIGDLCELNIWQKGLQKFLKETGDK